MVCQACHKGFLGEGLLTLGCLIRGLHKPSCSLLLYILSCCAAA